MTATEREGEAQSSSASPGRKWHGNVGTGLPVLDHLLGLLAVHGGFDIELEIAPGAPRPRPRRRVARSAGRSREPLRAGRAARPGVIPADEALAHVVLEASDRPLLVSNVDLSDARVAGLDTDIVARFLEGSRRAPG